ncbi:hypothetical protein ALC53_08957 [Atta colombica]|uniref:Uncharacterized protein n=1 Tax=Atta colombica TaxID=520822 RepID=A0A151I1N9_9HYME|nr:hypothetical protein ALC53_08957 [Atta colombica]
MGWLIACEQARFFLRLSFLAFPPSAISQTPHVPRCVYAAASNPIGLRLAPGARVCRVNVPRTVRRTGKRRQLFVLIIRNKEKAPPPKARVGKRLSSRRSGVKPEASNAVERSQLRRNDDVMDDRNTETGKRSEDGGGETTRLPSDGAAPQAIQFLNTSLSPLSSIPDISLLSNVRRETGEPSWLALMDDEGKERVIAERLSLSESRVLSFGRVRKKEKGGGEDKGGGKYRETRRELLGISRAR